MRLTIRIIAAAIMVISLAASAWGEDLCGEPVPTKEGPLRGAAEPGAAVCVYKGIPYAAPPIGELRWRAPEPAPPRNSLFNALSFGPECAQKGSEMPLQLGRQKIAQSEDCLYLNIWRPLKSGVFPVMVWIHGGTLLNGAGSRSIYWGDRLAQERDMVVVTINYRLGPFGFLSLREFAEEDEHGSAGNYGLLDQVKALQWVRDNIENFGGDPGEVTIFGESAGGWSVCNLMACPLAAGLFHRAVIESGGCDTTKTEEEGYADGAEFAERIGCSGSVAASCLRSKSTQEIIKGMGGAENLLSQEMMRMVYIPHEDGYALKETPLKALRSGRFNRVPLLVGTNRDEIKLAMVAVPGARLAPPFLIEWFIRGIFGPEVASGIKRHYPYRSYRRPADAWFEAFGDMSLGCKCFEAAEAVSEYQPHTYYYRFDYDRSLLPHMVGAAHGVEISFVFDTLDRTPTRILYSRGQTGKAEPMVEMMMGYWANFAATGNPNGEGLPEWPAYNTDSRRRMFLDLPAQSGPTDNVEKCAFWRGQDIRLK